MRFEESNARTDSTSRDCEPSCPSIFSGDRCNQLNDCLCEFKDVSEFDKSCIGKVNELIETQKQLQNAITSLEKREQESIKKLQQADCMWSCMEQAYKNKIQQANERQKLLLSKLNEIEKTNSQWKKMKCDLEIQLKHVKNSDKEIDEKINQKNNDLKTLDAEIESLKKRIEENKKETETFSKSFAVKKTNADAQIQKITDQIAVKNKEMVDEANAKTKIEREGNEMIKEAREDLRNSWKVLLQKRLENEDLKLEKSTILKDIEVLEAIKDECFLHCDDKQKEIQAEIKEIGDKIKNFKVRCSQCHRGVDTTDARYYCTDCPRCAKQRECLREGDTCVRDPSYECACMSTKRRFMDNVFDNMYIVLEKYIQTPAGKEIGKRILDCLKNSRNGKLDERTRKILQDFILTTVRKNLNLTIVGGAIKTRCEMDPDTFKELMKCLKEVKVQEISTEDKSTSKKAPCKRWESTCVECNCPGGPKKCVCSEKFPMLPRADDPSFPSPDDGADNDEDPAKDCNLHCGRPGEKMGFFSTDEYKGPPYDTNMRAAQCILATDYTSGGTEKNLLPPDSLETGETSKNENEPRESLVKELIGTFTDVDPIDRIKSLTLNSWEESSLSEDYE